MSLREAAEALLNALEDSGHKSDVMSACDALREALAEAPKAEVEKAELSDEEIEAIWFEQLHLERLKGNEPFSSAATAGCIRAALAAAKKATPAAMPESESLLRALHEIAEEYAGAECGTPVTAQEAYAIELARRMCGLAAEALAAARGKT